MDKQRIRRTMLGLESEGFDATTEAYREYFASARLDRSEPVDIDGHAQAIFARELAEAVDAPIHAHAENLRKLDAVDFSPKSAVEEGAVVRVGGCNLIIAVPTRPFQCGGEAFMGISADAPIYAALRGKRAGESFRFNGRDASIDLVA